MKSFLLILLLAVIGQAQTFFRVPATMAYDSLYTTESRVTADIWFNSRNNANYMSATGGSVDLDVYAVMKGQSTGSLTIEVYGLKRKKRDNVGRQETMVGDSVNVQGATSVDSTLWTFEIEKLWTNFPMYEGIRVVLKRTVADSIDVWYQAVVFKE